MVGLAPLSCGTNGGSPTAGSLDKTFGTAGKITTGIGTVSDSAYALAIQGDGKLVAAGNSSADIALVRYNTDGTFDTTFNSTGIVTTAIGTNFDEANALAIQGDGKLVAAGTSITGTHDVFALVRYNMDGSLDTTFNNTGIVTTAIGTIGDFAYALAIQGDGKLVAAGYSQYTFTQEVFALVRYNTDGSLDTTFNATGIVTTAIGTSTDHAYALAIQGDGKLVAAGTSSADIALVRYNTDGTLDTTFNSTGIVTTAIGTFGDIAFALAIQTDGKLVVAGSTSNGSQPKFALVRYNTDGSLDTSFNTTGIVTTAIATAIGTFGDVAFALAIQTDGKLVVAGSTSDGSQPKFALVRYNTDGSLDTTFNTTGIVTTAIGLGDYAYALAIQGDGKLVVAGASFSSANPLEFALARYWP
jgi:uncharacterized delta-60 repeat protein